MQRFMRAELCDKTGRTMRLHDTRNVVAVRAESEFRPAFYKLIWSKSSLNDKPMKVQVCSVAHITAVT